MILNFPWEYQDLDFWCWAAVSASVDRYFGVAPQWRQCEIASNCLTKTCCPGSANGPCDIPFYLQNALAFVGHLRLLAGPPGFAAVRAEIDSQNPVCLRIEWSDGGGHFITIYGYEVDSELGNRYLVADPITGGNTWRAENEVLFYYQSSGRCTDTYFVQ